MTNTTLSTNTTDSSDEMFYYYFYAIFGPVVMVVFLFSMKFFFEDEVEALFCKDRAALTRSRTLSLSVREFEMKKTEERRGSSSLREEVTSERNLQEYSTPKKSQERQNSESSVRFRAASTPEYGAEHDLSFSSPSNSSFGEQVGKSPLFPPPPPSLSESEAEEEEIKPPYNHQCSLKFIVSSAPIQSNTEDIMNVDSDMVHMESLETRKGDPGFKFRQDSVSEDQSVRSQPAMNEIRFVTPPSWVRKANSDTSPYNIGSAPMHSLLRMNRKSPGFE